MYRVFFFLFVSVDCFVMWCTLKMFHLTNKEARDLFCKASSPGTIDLIRTPGTVGKSFSVGDRVSRPIHETGFAKLVDQYIYIYIYIYVCVCVCVCVCTYVCTYL